MSTALEEYNDFIEELAAICNGRKQGTIMAGFAYILAQWFIEVNEVKRLEMMAQINLMVDIMIRTEREGESK